MEDLIFLVKLIWFIFIVSATLAIWSRLAKLQRETAKYSHLSLQLMIQINDRLGALVAATEKVAISPPLPPLPSSPPITYEDPKTYILIDANGKQTTKTASQLIAMAQRNEIPLHEQVYDGDKWIAVGSLFKSA